MEYICEESLGFLEILLNENLACKEHLSYIENKFAKNVGFLYKAKSFLNKICFLTLYHSYVQASINYANIAWGSSDFANLILQ